jgi:CheY-like chemotaxis protein
MIETKLEHVSELIHKGQYEEAEQALGELWQGVGSHPDITGLSPQIAADVILQCGVLSGWLGTTRRVPGAQEQAKDLIFEALRIFENRRLRSKVSEAKYELGICYWREGAFDEARIILREALEGSTDELRARILIRRTIIENCAGRYHDAWEILREAQPFFELAPDSIKGKWHGQLGLVLQRLALTEKREDYIDRAIIEFTAAIYHYEQAGNERYKAMNLNNLAMLLYPLGRYAEVYEALDQAEEIFKQDAGCLAQVRETRARALISEKRYEEAKAVIDRAVSILEGSREQALLADALVVQGLVNERLGEAEKSILILKRAIEIAEGAGSSLNAGFAGLTLIEEHHERLSDTDLYKLYTRVSTFLKNTEDKEALSRLKDAATLVMKRLLGPQITDKGFTLRKAVRQYEAKFIEQALELTGGVVSHAAKLLGFKHHGSLISLLQARHKALAKKRLPPTPRKATVRRPRNIGQCRVAAKTVTILYVEDYKFVSDAVRDTLRAEGWNIAFYEDGSSALREIESQNHYDLFLVDNDLPGVSGLELVQRIRNLPHRRNTPVIMMSATDCEREARRVGVDVFLKKPDGIHSLTQTISALLI